MSKHRLDLHEVELLDELMAYVHPAETIFSDERISSARLQIQHILGDRMEVDTATNKELYEYLAGITDLYLND